MEHLAKPQLQPIPSNTTVLFTHKLANRVSRQPNGSIYLNGPGLSSNDQLGAPSSSSNLQEQVSYKLMPKMVHRPSRKKMTEGPPPPIEYSETYLEKCMIQQPISPLPKPKPMSPNKKKQKILVQVPSNNAKQFAKGKAVVESKYAPSPRIGSQGSDKMGLPNEKATYVERISTASGKQFVSTGQMQISSGPASQSKFRRSREDLKSETSTGQDRKSVLQKQKTHASLLQDPPVHQVSSILDDLSQISKIVELHTAAIVEQKKSIKLYKNFQKFSIQDMLKRRRSDAKGGAAFQTTDTVSNSTVGEHLPPALSTSPDITTRLAPVLKSPQVNDLSLAKGEITIRVDTQDPKTGEPLKSDQRCFEQAIQRSSTQVSLTRIDDTQDLNQSETNARNVRGSRESINLENAHTNFVSTAHHWNQLQEPVDPLESTQISIDIQEKKSTDKGPQAPTSSSKVSTLYVPKNSRIDTILTKGRQYQSQLREKIKSKQLHKMKRLHPHYASTESFNEGRMAPEKATIMRHGCVPSFLNSKNSQVIISETQLNDSLGWKGFKKKLPEGSLRGGNSSQKVNVSLSRLSDQPVSLFEGRLNQSMFIENRYASVEEDPSKEETGKQLVSELKAYTSDQEKSHEIAPIKVKQYRGEMVMNSSDQIRIDGVPSTVSNVKINPKEVIIKRFFSKDLRPPVVIPKAKAKKKNQNIIMRSCAVQPLRGPTFLPFDPALTTLESSEKQKDLSHIRIVAQNQGPPNREETYSVYLKERQAADPTLFGGSRKSQVVHKLSSSINSQLKGKEHQKARLNNTLEKFGFTISAGNRFRYSHQTDGTPDRRSHLKSSYLQSKTGETLEAGSTHIANSRQIRDSTFTTLYPTLKVADNADDGLLGSAPDSETKLQRDSNALSSVARVSEDGEKILPTMTHLRRSLEASLDKKNPFQNRRQTVQKRPEQVAIRLQNYRLEVEQQRKLSTHFRLLTKPVEKSFPVRKLKVPFQSNEGLASILRNSQDSNDLPLLDSSDRRGGGDYSTQNTQHSLLAPVQMRSQFNASATTLEGPVQGLEATVQGQSFDLKENPFDKLSKKYLDYVSTGSEHQINKDLVFPTGKATIDAIFKQEQLNMIKDQSRTNPGQDKIVEQPAQFEKTGEPSETGPPPKST